MATLLALATEEPDPPALAGPLEPVLTGLLRQDPETRLTAAEVHAKLRAIVRIADKTRVLNIHAVVPGQRAPGESGGVAEAQPQRRGGGMGAALAAALADVVHPTTPHPVGDRNAEPAGVRGRVVPPLIRRSSQPHPTTARTAPAQREPAVEELRAPISPPFAPPTPRRSRSRSIAAGITLVALLAGGGIVASQLSQRDDDPNGAPIGAAPIVSSPSHAPSGGGPGGFSPLVCDREPSKDAPRTPRPRAKRQVNGWNLLPGFSYFADPAGFHIAVPDGWTYEKVGTTWCFHDPGGVRIMSFDPERNPKGNPVVACRNEEKRLLDAKALPGYQKIGIDAVPMLRAADWEFRYRGDEKARMHVLTHWFASGDKAYALGWMTRDFDFGSSKGIYDAIVSSFYGDKPVGARATPKESRRR